MGQRTDAQWLRRSWLLRRAWRRVALGVGARRRRSHRRAPAAPTRHDRRRAIALRQGLGHVPAAEASRARPTCTCWPSTTSTATSRPAGQNIYGQFAGGAAYLAKAIKDRQAQYGDHAGDGLRRRQHRRQPARQRAVLRGAVTIVANLMHVDFASVGNHEFDKGRHELLRIQNGGCRAGRRLHRRRRTRSANGEHDQQLPGRRLPVPVGERDRRRRPARRCSRRTASSSSSRDSGKKFEVGFIGEVLKSTPTIVTPTGVAGLTFQDEADAANQAVAELRAQGRRRRRSSSSTRAASRPAPPTLNGCAGNLAGSPIADIASAARPVDQGDHLGAHPRRVPLHDHHRTASRG